MARYDFLVETYRTERLKTLGVWAQIPESRMRFRPEPRARTPLEHMVHQCMSEEAWMKTMLGIAIARTALPAQETRLAFFEHYAAATDERLTMLATKTEEWFEATVPFFDVERSRAWVLVRRYTHSAHHRGQLTQLVRSWGQPLYSTYGPTADTGGLARDGAKVIYRYASVEELLAGEKSGGRGGAPKLPGPGPQPPTERADAG